MDTNSEIRVMVVDDHAIVRSGVSMLIGIQDGMTVVGEAGCAESATAQVADLAPDVVLMDISMPGKSGIAAIADIRRECPSARVLILTMHDEQTYLRSAIQAGAAGYIPKSSVDVELVHAIRSVADGKLYVNVSLEEPKGQRWTPSLGRGGSASMSTLTPRERQVLELVAYGHTQKGIGERMGISVKTVEAHRTRLGEKLGVRNRAELVRFALDAGILKPTSE